MSNDDQSKTFSEKVKNESSQVRWRTISERQAVIAGAFCAASPEMLSLPATSIRTTPQACLSLAGLLAQDGFVHLVRGNKLMVLEQSFVPFTNLLSACFMKNAVEQLTLNRTFTRCFLRGAFLSEGYCANPSKSYRIEFRISNSQIASLIVAMLESVDIKPIVAQRDSYELIYFKNGDMVSDFLGVIGATGAVMEFENYRASRELNGSVVRAVNCDSGNLKRTASASARRSLAFDKITKAGIKGTLPKELADTLDAHYSNPEASIAELAAMMDPPIHKSGMNHRINKLMEIAEGLE